MAKATGRTYKLKPTILERLRMAVRFFRNGYEGFEYKRAPFLWPVYRTQIPQASPISVDSYVEDGFEKNSVLYSAIMYCVRAANSAPLRAYRGTPDAPEPLPSGHPLVELCARPNPHQAWAEFNATAWAYFKLLGNCFIYVDRGRRDQWPPDALYTLRPDRVRIIPDNRGGLKGFVYVREAEATGVPILPQDMMHVRLPNPADPLEGMGWGMSGVTPAAWSVDVDNELTRFLKLFVQKGAMPPGLLSFDTPMTDEDIARARERWREIYGGVDNWSDVAIMDQGGQYQRLSLSFAEMALDSLDSRNESRIAAPLGVPLILLETRGALAAATYANKKEARRMFWEDTMLPDMLLFEQEYNYFLNQGPNFVAFDYSQVPALQMDMPALVEAAYKLWQMGEPRNRAYAIVGLEVGETQPEGDTGYLPLNVVPVSDVGTPTPLPSAIPAPAILPPKPEPEEEGGEEPEATGDEEEERREGESKSWSPAAKAVRWKQFDRIATSWEGKFSAAARKVFEVERRDLLALLTAEKQLAREAKATIDWVSYQERVEEYLEAAGPAWRDAFLPLVKGIVTDQGNELAALLGMQFNVRNLEAEGWFDRYMLKFAQDINATTKKELGQMLQQAQREGWSISDMQKRMTSMFKQWQSGDLSKEEFAWYEQRMPAYRTEAIARTETCRSSNAGSDKLYQDWGVKKKNG